MTEKLKPILLTALCGGQIDHSLANAIAVAAGIDLTEIIDPAKTADNLRFIGQNLLERGIIDAGIASAYVLVADSILDQLDKFEVA